MICQISPNIIWNNILIHIVIHVLIHILYTHIICSYYTHCGDQGVKSGLQAADHELQEVRGLDGWRNLWRNASRPMGVLTWRITGVWRGEEISIIKLFHKMTGWWYTYPSEKWWTSSVGMMTFHSQLFLESHKIPWFQSPPTRWIDYIVIPIIN